MRSLKSIFIFTATNAFLCLAYFVAKAQNCPANIDFETGDFTGWTCYTGTTYSQNGQNVITFSYTGGPVYNQQTMYSSNPGDGLDEYGDFPINCPNGSGHSIRLGNNLPNTEAEGVSYDFTIPANANIYNLIYNYAVVFQDPGHLPSEQPRLEIEILNLSDNRLIDCSSFTFFANGTILPGFELSNNPGGNTPVWFKRWTAVSVNLDGLAGKTIRLFFKTADCTFRRHFGYAYVDVNTECSDKFTGAEFCPDDSAVFVTAPYGYQGYTWYNSGFTQVLGNQQTLSFDPPPPTGTTVGVILTPYNGYGCLDTLYTDLTNTLNYKANAGPDLRSCNNTLVQLGVPPKPGWIYNWSPATGLNDANISNPLASPSVNTTYVLSITHSGGGCVSTDTAEVKAAKLDNTLQFEGKTSWCIGSGDSAVLSVQPADSIQWFNNNIPIAGANQRLYRVTQTGSYHAVVFSDAGCILPTTKQQVDISSVPVAGISVNTNSQCQLGNKFIFTNNSTNAVGAMSYEWRTGDGSLYSSRDIIHSYLAPGPYQVTMKVSSNTSCSDSSSLTINVYPNVDAAFTAAPICVNLPLTPVNKTVEPQNTRVFYLWDFGNGQTSTLRNPPPAVYSNPGAYRIKLSVSSEQCPSPLHTAQQVIKVDEPTKAIRYPVNYAVANLPLFLRARPIGADVIWSPPVSLDNPASYTPVFVSANEQLYTITLKTISGCTTVDTQLVKINKSIVIYVPNSFTPNNDGLNDILRPFMIGIKELSYFKIFNRWGQLIYQTSKIQDGWDGRFKGVPAGTQTLVWVLEGIGADNKKYQAKGTTILIR
jgi:gliding motility-associated-like protein